MAAALTLAPVCACAHAGKAAPGPVPSTSLLIGARGAIVTLPQAQSRVRFAPFVPGAQIVAVALIPPLHVDHRKDAGVAMEYERAGDALLLSQWPRGDLNVGVAGNAIHRPCAPVAYKADGFLWTTRSGLVMTLQPDGAVAPGRLMREARRLAAGSCRTRG
jgi:hypothetical protein